MPRSTPRLVRGVDAKALRRAADTIRVLGHPDRLKIVEVLEGAPHTVTEIQDLLGLEQAIVSQHLARLRGHGIVDAERRGVNVYYRVIEPKVQLILECIRKCDL